MFISFCTQYEPNGTNSETRRLKDHPQLRIMIIYECPYWSMITPAVSQSLEGQLIYFANLPHIHKAQKIGCEREEFIHPLSLILKLSILHIIFSQKMWQFLVKSPEITIHKVHNMIKN